MKIGIIVYSETGNTLSVANNLYEELKSKYSVNIERVEATRKKNDNSSIILNKEPDVSKYDTIVFCSYVEGFSLCPVMKKYLMNINTLQNKKIFCFITQHFPPWMGGNRTIGQMETIIKEKNGNIIEKGIINWSSKKRNQMIKDLIQKFKEEIK